MLKFDVPVLLYENMAGSREGSRTTSKPAGSYELSGFSLENSCERQKVHRNQGDSDVVRERSREPAMLQIGL